MRSPRGRTATRDDQGFTLIELTVVLAVIVTLALILTPSVVNYLNDARIARSRSDTQTIATAITQFYRDTGFFPQWTASQNGGPGSAGNKIDLLISPGSIPTAAEQTLWITGRADTLANQLLANAPGYRMRTATSSFGWNGPYLSSDIGADAWGNRYMVNVGLLDSTTGLQAAGGGLKNAVWVMSAGPNGAIDTLYAQPTTTAIPAGDDIYHRLQ